MPKTASHNIGQRQALPVHFEDFDWRQFERLVFAYHARVGQWDRLEWYGQCGSDRGRDIWGVEQRQPRAVCIACANFRRLTFTKAHEDIDKIVAAPYGKPGLLRIVVGGNVSAKMRDRVRAYAKSVGIPETDVWSAAEFEEYLRRDAEALLKRFCDGELFPDAAPDLAMMAAIGQPTTDAERFALLARVLDRPAFTTPIRQECSLPHFKKAITDTIQALNTGCWQTREGIQLGRVPRRDEIEDPAARQHLANCVDHLVKLRAAYDELECRGELRPCGCGVDDCPCVFMSDRAAATISRHRNAVIREATSAWPGMPLRELPEVWSDLLDGEEGTDANA